jgi:hypothetical protein
VETKKEETGGLPGWHVDLCKCGNVKRASLETQNVPGCHTVRARYEDELLWLPGIVKNGLTMLLDINDAVWGAAEQTKGGANPSHRRRSGGPSF